jgi:tetratricopeptide (TPR) repeat protein
MQEVCMRLAVIVGLLALPTVTWAQYRLPKGEEEVNRASEMMVRFDYAGAEPLLRRAIADTPRDPYAHYNLAALLRATGRYDEAIAEYDRAKELFETTDRHANGRGDVGNCLYGIALATEAKDDPQAAARAWNDYIRFAQRFALRSGTSASGRRLRSRNRICGWRTNWRARGRAFPGRPKRPVRARRDEAPRGARPRPRARTPDLSLTGQGRAAALRA